MLSSSFATFLADLSVSYLQLDKVFEQTNLAANLCIIACFISRYKRNQIYANRFNAKSIEELPFEDMDKI